MTKKRDILSLIACFAIALGCRLLRRSSELLSSDAADLASNVAHLLCSEESFPEIIQELALYRLGGIQPLVVFAHGFVAKTLDVPLEPTTWEWSTILVSSVSSPLAFLVGRRFGGPVAGWAWAAFLATSPIHVMLGRNLGAPWAYEIDFQLAIILLADRYLASSTRASGAGLWSALAGYFWCGNQMLAIFPVVMFAFLTHAVAQPKEERLAFLRRKLLTLWLLLPLMSLGVLLHCTFILNKGHLYHALSEKQKSWGWYWNNFYSDLTHNLGYVPTWVAFGALLCALLVPGPLLHRRRIPLVYALCYTLPFVFLVSRATTLTRGYCVYGVTGLLGLVALAPNNFHEILLRCRLALSARIRLAAMSGLLVLTAIFLMTASGASVYKLYPNQTFLGAKGFQGSFGRPIGAAAAAGFISRIASGAGAPSGKIFSDAYGGTGLEPPIMRLYFNRPSFVHYDAPRMAPWKAFGPRADEVGFAVIRPENASLVNEYFPELSMAATISSERGPEPVLLVYVRGFTGSPINLSVEAGIKEYSASFPHFCSR